MKKTMKILKLYLETSVWNFLFALDAPDKQAITIDFFAWAQTGACELYISAEVLAEVEDAPTEKRDVLVNAIDLYKPEPVAGTDEAIELAKHYIQAGILPAKASMDARHVAIATIGELDVIVSWNLRHLVKHKTRRGVNAINLLRGYKMIDICTPEEVMSNAGE